MVDGFLFLLIMVSQYSDQELSEKYELELDRVVSEIKNKKAKLVLLQFPDGLKIYATSVVDFCERPDGRVQTALLAARALYRTAHAEQISSKRRKRHATRPGHTGTAVGVLSVDTAVSAGRRDGF